MIQRDVKQFVLKALLRANKQLINDETLKQLVRSAFSHVAIAETDLVKWIKELESSGILVRNEDAVFGTMWGLSLAGENSAKQIR
jgi:hypothetical protein